MAIRSDHKTYSKANRVNLVTLTANSWHGPLPTPGIYLRTTSGRTAYEVVEFRPCRPGSKAVGRLRCRRTEPSEIPEGATVVEWTWSSRG
jgi:hypothetical protein